jgi:hypothetical protein
MGDAVVRNRGARGHGLLCLGMETAALTLKLKALPGRGLRNAYGRNHPPSRSSTKDLCFSVPLSPFRLANFNVQRSVLSVHFTPCV